MMKKYTIVLASRNKGKVRELERLLNEMLGDVLGAVKEGYEKGEDIGGTIGTAGALIGLGSAMGGDGEVNKDDMVTSLTSLIQNLNDFTIGLLPKILSTNTIVEMGVPAEHAALIFTL